MPVELELEVRCKYCSQEVDAEMLGDELIVGSCKCSTFNRKEVDKKVKAIMAILEHIGDEEYVVQINEEEK
jgi:hypothetical protein